VTREHGKKLLDMLKRGSRLPQLSWTSEACRSHPCPSSPRPFGRLALEHGDRVLEEIELRNIDPFADALVKDIVSKFALVGGKEAPSSLRRGFLKNAGRWFRLVGERPSPPTHP